MNYGDAEMVQGISIQGVSKEFSGKYALKNVSLDIQRGTVHAIIGENGAGKSTLMNILCGVLTPSKGSLALDGTPAVLRHPGDAAGLGIGMVHQHFMLVPSLTVWQNIILGIEPIKGAFIDQKRALKLIEDTCREYGMDINPHQIVGTLTVGEQQRVEILKVLIRSANIIILDEPTAVLTPQEIDQLFENIRILKSKGKTILFISHKLEEVLNIADEITVLHLGEKIGTIPVSEATPDRLIHMMVGREVQIDGYPLETPKGEPVLKVSALCTPRSQYASGLDHIDLTVHAGEVVGIAGVDGNGQNDFVRAILGMELISSGSIEKDGVDITKKTSNQIRSCGVSLIPPDRQKQGLVMNSSILLNTLLGCEDNKAVCSGGIINIGKARALTEKLTADYDVRMPSIDANSGELSGGNQQKIILAREFGIREGNLILAVNPTRGLDIGAIEFVYEQIEKQKKAGKAVLLVSTELSEILRLSDRIAVFFKGRCMKVLDRAEANVDQIGMLMMGLSDDQEVQA